MDFVLQTKVWQCMQAFKLNLGVEIYDFFKLKFCVILKPFVKNINKTEKIFKRRGL